MPIIPHMNDNEKNVLHLATLLMAEPSVTPDAAECFNLIEAWLAPLGFTVWRETFEEEGYPPTENLYARLGNASPNVCFAGHVDVVPEGDSAAWENPPYEPRVIDGYLHGRGAEDMKGAVAAFIAAVMRYVEGGNHKQGSISFLLTADEEGIAINGTKKMLTWLEEKDEKLDYCLVGEPTNPTYMGEMCKLGRRGSLLCHLEVVGTQGHIAYPALADNPITRLVNILHRLKSESIDNGSEFFPPSNLEVTTVDVANDVSNLIPAKATAAFNIRFNDQHSGATLQEWVRAQCDAAAAGESYNLEMRISGESFLTPVGKLSDALQKAAHDVTGHTPELSTTGGTSDARFIKDVCPVIEFGTTGFTPHKVNERVGVDALEQLEDVYYHFLGEMLG